MSDVTGPGVLPAQPITFGEQRASIPGNPGDLLRDADFAPPHDLPDVVDRHLTALGVHDVALYVADLQQKQLVPFVGIHNTAFTGHVESLSIDSTVAGRAYQQSVTVTHALDDGATRVWLPLLRGSERLGVVGVTLGADAADPDQTMVDVERLVTATAHLLASRMVYADALLNLQRRSSMGVAAEMQWSLLPPLTYTGDGVTIAAILEPAYEVGGDCVDYSIENGSVQFGLFDGMGHGLASAQTATLAVSTYRNARRAHCSLSETAGRIDETLMSIYAGETFTTGVLARLDTDTGVLSWVNLGHPRPLVFRAGRHVKSLSSAPGLPMGLWSLDAAGHHPGMPSEQLEPGDQVLLYTDGVVEARAPGGELFGTDRLVDLVERNFADGMQPSESMRRIAISLLAHQQDQLRDDATILLVQWLP